MIVMQTTRDLSVFYSWLDDPRRQQDTQEARELISAFVTKRKWRTDYIHDVSLLMQVLDEYNTIRHRFVYWTIDSMYLYMRNVTNDDAEVRVALAKSEKESTEIFNELTFFELSLWWIPTERQELILMDNRIVNYHHFLEEIFENAKYQLSEKEEKLISLMSWPAYSNWTRMMEDFFFGETVELDGETLPVENLLSLISNTNKPKRDAAAKAFNELLKKYLKIAEREYNSVIDYKHHIDELRGYDVPRRSGCIRDGISKETITAMASAVVDTYDISQQFYALKAKLLWVDQLEYHERNVPIVVWEEKKYPIDETVQLVSEVFGSLKPEYWKFVTMMFDTGKVDVFPRAWKKWWAFCCTDLSNQYWQLILLNHADKLRDVLTVAHEFGHGLNGYLSSLNHTGLTHGSGGYMMAETASTFFEWITFSHLLATIEDPRQKIALLVNKLNDEISTIHRQIASFEFEKELHTLKKQKWYVTHEQIWTLYQKHMVSYMWEAVEQSPWSQNRRLYVSHFRSFFYNYPYTWWILIANALRAKLNDDSQFIHEIEEKYFRNSGAMSAEKIFKSLWVDITLQSTWEVWLNVLRSQLEEVERLIDTYGRNA